MMPKSFLETILNHKHQEVEIAKQRLPQTELHKTIEGIDNRQSLIKRLSRSNRVNIIAEIKRASPSKGVLKKDLDAAKTAQQYQAAGAAAISVLTDQRYFMGSREDLEQVKTAVNIPVLRKDFIISEYQIYESAAMGADVILLIVRILSQHQLHDYLNLCRELNLEALVEVHSDEDLDQAMTTDAKLIGINNRDLSTFDTHLSRAVHMSQRLAADRIPVVASGIQNRKDILKNCSAGLSNFLVGESLVKAKHPGERLKSYLEVSLDS